MRSISAEMKSIYPSTKTLSVWTRFVILPIAFPIAGILHRIGMSANQVTYTSILISFVAAGLTATAKYELVLLGAFLFNVYLVLDFVDGNIARISGKDSPYGTWIDNLGGYLTYVLIFLSVGIAAQSQSTLHSGLITIDYILVGTIATVSNLLVRNLHQKMNMVENSGNEDSPSPNSNSSSLLFTINQNVGLVGLLTPFLIISSIIGFLDVFLIFYASYYTAMLISYMGYQIWRIESGI